MVDPGNKPVVLLDETKCKRNLLRMATKAQKLGLTLRPHFKTHQSADVGQWCRELDIQKCTVSSVMMAGYFAKCGWKDITIAFPFNILEWEDIKALAQRVQLQVTITSMETLHPLLERTDARLGVFLKIELGTFRTGFDPDNPAQISEAIRLLSQHSKYTFRGFLGHAGHSYDCRSPECIQHVHNESRNILTSLKERFIEAHKDLILSPGDTPTCSMADDWDGIDEIRPGNFVYYDVTQYVIGACGLDDIAVALAAPVVAKHPERNTIIVYGGGIHLSKDRIMWRGHMIYGLPTLLTESAWEVPDLESFVSGISQEHGVIQATAKLYEKVSVGDHIAILPVHSCMMCDLMKSVKVLQTGTVLQMMTTY